MEKPKHNWNKAIEFLTDRFAMFAAIIVSLGTVTLMFVVITPDVFGYRVVMGSMGFILVLFSPRALAKRKFKLWVWIASLIVFSEVSTVLTMTDSQSQDANTTVVVIDPVLKHLQDNTKTAQDNLTNIIDQQAKAQNRVTLDSLASQFTLLTSIYNNALAMENAYHGTGKAASGGIDPKKLFMAIPTAIFSGDLSRYMTLIFSLIVAVVFQLVIRATVTDTVKHIKSSVEKVPKKPKRPSRKPRSKPDEAKEITESDFIKETEDVSMLEAL